MCIFKKEHNITFPLMKIEAREDGRSIPNHYLVGSRRCGSMDLIGVAASRSVLQQCLKPTLVSKPPKVHSHRSVYFW